MGITNEQVSLWLEKLNSLEEKLEHLETQIEFAKEDKMKVKEYEKVNKEIDTTINAIAQLQNRIEREIVSRSLTDEKAKEFVDKEKAANNEKIEELKNGDIKDLEEIESKLKENKNLEEINTLIQGKFNVQEKIDGYKQNKEDLEEELRGIEQDLADAQDELNSASTPEEKRSIRLKINQLQANRKNINWKIKDINQKISECRIALSSLESHLNEYGVPELYNKEIQEFYPSVDVSLMSIDEKLIAIQSNNKNQIDSNKKEIREAAKDELGMKAKFVKDEEIQAVLDEKLGQKRDELARLEEREIGFNEAELIKAVKDDFAKTGQNMPAESNSLENIITKLVDERNRGYQEEPKTTNNSPEEQANEGNKKSQKVSKRNLPVPVTQKDKKVGFFKRLWQSTFSRNFSAKRTEIVNNMYPELSDKMRKKYISNHGNILDDMIRNGVTAEDVEEAKIIQAQARQENKTRIRDNDFISKLREGIETGKNVSEISNEVATEKMKSAKDKLKNEGRD